MVPIVADVLGLTTKAEQSRIHRMQLKAANYQESFQNAQCVLAFTEGNERFDTFETEWNRTMLDFST